MTEILGTLRKTPLTLILSISFSSKIDSKAVIRLQDGCFKAKNKEIGLSLWGLPFFMRGFLHLAQIKLENSYV
jgi:hypothetical protein